MKRSSEFLVALVAALITFGSLTLALGPRQFAWRGHHHYNGHGPHHSHDSCSGEEGGHHDGKNESKDSGDS